MISNLYGSLIGSIDRFMLFLARGDPSVNPWDRLIWEGSKCTKLLLSIQAVEYHFFNQSFWPDSRSMSNFLDNSDSVKMKKIIYNIDK